MSHFRVLSTSTAQKCTTTNASKVIRIGDIESYSSKTNDYFQDTLKIIVASFLTPKSLYPGPIYEMQSCFFTQISPLLLMWLDIALSCSCSITGWILCTKWWHFTKSIASKWKNFWNYTTLLLRALETSWTADNNYIAKHSHVLPTVASLDWTKILTPTKILDIEPYPKQNKWFYHGYI